MNDPVLTREEMAELLGTCRNLGRGPYRSQIVCWPTTTEDWRVPRGIVRAGLRPAGPDDQIFFRCWPDGGAS